MVVELFTFLGNITFVLFGLLMPGLFLRSAILSFNEGFSVLKLLNIKLDDKTVILLLEVFLLGIFVTFIASIWHFSQDLATLSSKNTILKRAFIGSLSIYLAGKLATMTSNTRNTRLMLFVLFIPIMLLISSLLLGLIFRPEGLFIEQNTPLSIALYLNCESQMHRIVYNNHGDSSILIYGYTVNDKNTLNITNPAKEIVNITGKQGQSRPIQFKCEKDNMLYLWTDIGIFDIPFSFEKKVVIVSSQLG